jgi:alkylation response protein AidB-like acyl-CoA dehydrogenase
MALIDNEDQRALAATVRRFVAERTPLAAVRATAFSGQAYDPSVWRGLTTDLGLSSLAIPVEYGGDGGTRADLAVALRELGAGLVPSPLLASAVMAAGTLLALDDAEAKKAWLAPIAAGDVIGTLATSEPGSRSWIPPFPATTATTATGAAGTFALTGTKTAVLNAADADILLVQAMSPDGPGVYLVSRDAAGVSVTPAACLDPTRGVATVTFDQSPAVPLAGDAVAALDHVADLVNIAVAAEQVGALRACIDLTAGYARTRYSFGHPIGAYQGVKHRLADMYTDWALADAALRKATEEGTEGGSAERSAAATAARVLSSPAYVNAAKYTMLLHGGIGFTWEHDAHLYYKNAVTSNVLFGAPEYQQLRLADKLLA